VENNAANGVRVQSLSNLYLHASGGLTIQNNVNIGLAINQGSVLVESMLTVSGTTSTTGSGIGINIDNKSALGVSGDLLVQNNTGVGINIQTGSQVQL
jgi:hypothetical protein